MKIKTRLILSFCVILFLPIALACGALFGLYQFQVHSIKQVYGEETENTSFFFSNSVQVLNQYIQDDFEDLQKMGRWDPETLKDISYLESKNEILAERDAFLIVSLNERLIYNGYDGEINVSEEELVEALPDFGTADARDGSFFLEGNLQWLIKQIDFVDAYGNKGCVYLVAFVDSVFPEMRQLLTDLGISIILILVLTAAVVTLSIYRSIMSPISKLKKATQNIRDGNLDFALEAESDDEIGELTRNFEQMRRRLKESTAEKITSEKENRVLISNIAHDLKTPITTVKGYAEGLMDGVADTPEKQEKYIRMIYNKANEMDRLINELTLYSKIDTNRIPYNFQKLNVTDYFRDCIEEIGMELEEAGIGLAYYNYADPKTVIIADPEQLMRVISNIVGNSVKYMDKKVGFINIRIKDVGDFIQVELEDNGQGIDMKDLPHVFDRFYRSDASRNSSTGGSGIGLSIVRKIIEDHGGKIWATSKVGTGTIMYFVIRKYQEVPYE